MNNDPIKNAPVHAVKKIDHTPALEPELMIIEALFSKQVNLKKAEATDKLEVGQNQVKMLDKLQNVINLSSTSEGMAVSEALKNLLNKELDTNAFDQTQKNKDLLDLLRKIKESLESKQVPDFQPLFAFLNDHPNKSMSAKLESLGIVDGSQPTKRQLANFREVIEDKEAKNTSREYRKAQHDTFIQLIKESGILFKAQPYNNQNLQNLFNELAGQPQHPLNAKLGEIGIVAGKKPTDAQLNALVEIANGDESPENRKMRQLLRDHGIIGLPENFTKQQTDGILSRIKRDIKEKEIFNNVETRKIQEFDSLMHKLYQTLMSNAKVLNEIKKKMASNIKGG